MSVWRIYDIGVSYPAEITIEKTLGRRVGVRTNGHAVTAEFDEERRWPS
jgi:hypothetical protein